MAIFISAGTWLTKEDYNKKVSACLDYDFCSFCATDGEHKEKVCGTIATRICRLEKVDKSRFRCETCPLDMLDDDSESTMILTPSSDSKLARVSKHINSQKRSIFLFQN